MANQSDGGRIINISSVASLVGFPGSAHYAASKHGVIGLTQTMAVDMHRTESPSTRYSHNQLAVTRSGKLADAKSSDSLPDFGGISDSFNLLSDKEMPLAAGDTEAVLWLASDAARFLTGVALPVDAGFTAK